MNLISVLPAIRRAGTLAVGALGILASGAFADSISPTSYSASLGVGESVTIRKTVTVTEAPPTSALIDVMFVFDTTGSMGPGIDGAKAMAGGLLASLGSFGSVASGVGFYNDPTFGVLQTVTTTAATTVATIASLSVSGGGDYPELGYAGITAAADGGGWRAGSNRFIIALGDAGFKPDSAIASTIAAMGAVGADLIGIDFCSSAGTCALAPTFASSIGGLGGTTYASSASPADIAAAITAGITAGFAKYTTVTVDDLGGGGGIIDVAATCVSADSGACVGADAVGTYDRSVERTFEFDVTFTRLAGGDLVFDTFAIVDRGIVAAERDTFTTPEPATLVLMGVSLLGIGAARRRRSS